MGWLLLARIGSKLQKATRSVLYVSVPPCTSGLCERMFFSWWRQKYKKETPTLEAHFKPLLISCPWTFHWPKQITWSWVHQYSGEYFQSLFRRSIVSHGKGFGYRKVWWIHNNNAVYHRSIKVLMDMVDAEFWAFILILIFTLSSPACLVPSWHTNPHGLCLYKNLVWDLIV